MSHQVQAERLGASGGGASDAAEGDEAKRHALQTRHLQHLRPAFRPAAFAHHAVLVERAAVRGQQQHHRVVGDFLDEGVGAIGDGDALLGGGGDIDIVDADGAERDVPAFVQRHDHRSSELHGLGVDRIGALGGGNKARFGGGTFDDFGVKTLERLHLVAIAATGDRE